MQNLRDAVINLSKEETGPWFLAKESNAATLTYNLEVQTELCYTIQIQACPFTRKFL